MLQRLSDIDHDTWAQAATPVAVPERLLIVSDAWHPQVNGVVRSIENTNRELTRMGVEVSMITPDGFRNIPCPTYPEIRLSIASYSKIASRIEAVRPTYVHIATEGPLGLTARRWCLRNKMPFPPAITRASPNMSQPACRYRKAGSTPSSNGFTMPVMAAWWQRQASRPN